MGESVHNNPKISVIVPVYKVEQYLDRCVKSILGQSFKDFELILVDDGSPDKSGEMCDEWAKKDNRIIVIHKQNGGLSDARNCGIAKCSAQYVTFIDSDDYVREDFLSYLYDMAVKNNSDISMCQFINIHGEDFERLTEENDIIEFPSYQDCCIRFCQDAQYCVAVCKLYRMDLLLKYPFPVGRMHEDAATVGKLLYEAEKISVGTKKLYGYYQNPQSITHTYSKKRFEDQLWAVTENALFFEGKNEKLIARHSWNLLGSILFNLSDYKELNKDVFTHYYHQYKKHCRIDSMAIKLSIKVHAPFAYYILKKIKRVVHG